MQRFDPEFFERFQKLRERNLFRLTKRFFHIMGGRLEAQMAERGFADFKMVYYGFVANLDLNGTTSSELAGRLCVTKQAISKLMKEIEQLGYIEFHPHETDGRAAIIHLTEKGEQLLRTGMEVGLLLRQDLVKKVGEKALEQMVDTLKIIVEDEK